MKTKVKVQRGDRKDNLLKVLKREGQSSRGLMFNIFAVIKKINKALYIFQGPT